MAVPHLGVRAMLGGVALAGALLVGAAYASGGLTGSVSGPSSATSGSYISYTISATDATLTAGGVTVTDFLDPHELFVSLSPALPCSQTPAVGQSGVLSCQLGLPNFATGQTATLTLTVAIPAGTSGDLTNSAAFSDGVNSDVQSAVTSVSSIGTALQLTGISINAQPNQTFSGAVATFTDPNCGSQSAYAVTIDWGDGAASYETLPGNVCVNATISGTHMYTSSGSYTVTVIVQGYTNPSAYASAQATASIGVAPATAVNNPASSPYTPPLNYSGQGWDPSCEYGCPPGGHS